MIARLMALLDDAIETFLSAVIDRLTRKWIEKGER